MDVVANNIANVNTVGFKKSRVTFQDQLSQTIRQAYVPQTGRGGTNPMQVGLGVTIGSIDTINSQGNIQSTGKGTDLAIEGDGYFILRGTEEDDYFYTRAGNFDVDSGGALISMVNGMRVMGYLYDPATGEIDRGRLTEIVLPRSVYLEPEATDKITFMNNLNAEAQVGDTYRISREVYDSEGRKHNIHFEFTKRGVNEWIYEVSLPVDHPLIQNYLDTNYPNFNNLSPEEQELAVLEAQNYVFSVQPREVLLDDEVIATAVQSFSGLDPDAQYRLHYDSAAGEIVLQESTDGGNNWNDVGSPQLASWGTSVTFSDGTKSVTVELVAAADAPAGDYDTTFTLLTDRKGMLEFDEFGKLIGDSSYIYRLEFQPEGAEKLGIDLDFTGVTQFAGGFSIVADQEPGAVSGTLDNFTIDASGIITGRFSNGYTRILGQVALAGFNNPAGLTRVGDNMFKPTSSSGEPRIGVPNTLGRGKIKPGALEMSNVNLAEEFTDMIVTQRGFQANARVITTSDEMLQELIGLKR
ncbi:hypothetical protein Nther_1400 [Calderihabitans maritimus]|uniref:Flagellar hook protein FlgE n=2 Tax=Calderihabitans maritimus TaxID=1246530 RepID=A0A1Z5HTS3_9FIRM|nr:hypothetical protein Nther_1400 [Calderihabitans maritimus]